MRKKTNGCACSARSTFRDFEQQPSFGTAAPRREIEGKIEGSLSQTFTFVSNSDAPERLKF